MISIEVAAKTVQKAIEEGLEKLGKSIDEVDIKILSSGGLFKKAKVEITVLGFDGKPVKENKEQKENVQKIQVPPFKAEPKPEPKNEIDAKPFSKPQQKEQNQKPEQKPFTKKEDSAVQEQKPFERKSQSPLQNSQQKPEQKTEQKPFTKREGAAGQEQKPERKSQSTPQRAEKQDIKQKQERGYQPFRRQSGAALGDAKGDESVVKNDEHRQRPKTEVTEEVVKQASCFVEDLLKKMDITEYTFKSSIVDGDLLLAIECNSGAVIGYRGETLDSIEYLTSLAVNKNDDKYYKINVDCNDYRSKRVETLSALANRMADKAVKTGRKVVLEPMSSSSRKIIHSVLSANDRIITKSEGREPNRRIIIIPKRYRQTNDQTNDN